MKARDIFQLVLKSAGLIVALQGLGSLLEWAMILKQYVRPETSSSYYWLVRGLAECVAGGYLIRTQTVINWAFPIAHKGADREESEAKAI